MNSPKTLFRLFAGTMLACLTSLSIANGQVFTTLGELPPELYESSGIETTSPNEVWTFNDSGGQPELYLCDTFGTLQRTVFIAEAWNRDWEDITQDDEGNFYIGNIGNNANDATDLTIFKIPNPTTAPTDTVLAEVISFAYADQASFPPPSDSLNYDCEALMWFDDHLYLSTKNRTEPFDGYTHLYRLPATPGEHLAERISSFNTEGTVQLLDWVTAGDISPDGSQLVLLTTDKVWLFYDFEGDDFFSGEALRIDLPFPSKKEAICYATDSRLYITDEDVGGIIGRQLYALDITGLPNATSEAPTEEWLAFPNPTSGLLSFSGLGYSPKEIAIHTIDGQLLQQQTWAPGQLIDLGDYPSGVYLITLEFDGQYQRIKLVKQ